MSIQTHGLTTQERLIHHRVIDRDGCWIWPLSQTKGYGQTKVSGRTVYTHRLSYEIHIGPIPDGMTVDHLCFKLLCFNPEHLRLLTHSDNAANQRAGYKTHCKNGHEYTQENTYVRPRRFREGVRDCRTCIRDRVARYKARKAVE